jgi:hypothetical protein
VPGQKPCRLLLLPLLLLLLPLLLHQLLQGTLAA